MKFFCHGTCGLWCDDAGLHTVVHPNNADCGKSNIVTMGTLVTANQFIRGILLRQFDDFSCRVVRVFIDFHLVTECSVSVNCIEVFNNREDWRKFSKNHDVAFEVQMF